MSYAIETAKCITEEENIVVLTDDEEIDLIARRLMVNSFIIRNSDQFPTKFGIPPTLGVLTETERRRGERFEFVAWLGPSSPFLKTRDILEAVQYLGRNGADAVFSVSYEPQRAWLYDVTYQPAFIEIPNTQQNGLMHRETGAFFIMSRSAVDENGYSGKKGVPFFLPAVHAIEINSFHDWWIAEKLLNRRQILFVVAGYPEIGMGHVYRALMLAQEFHDHEIQFLCTSRSQLAFDYISEHLYPASLQKQDENLSDAVLRLSPDLVVNDILDTSKAYMLSLKNSGIRTVNFEDEGEGAICADLVINALYERNLSSNMLAGHEYFCLRSEFLTASRHAFRDQVKNVLITFGGTDNGNLTLRVLRILLPLALEHNFTISVVNGPGYVHQSSLKKFLSLLDNYEKGKVLWPEEGTKQISEYMMESDFAVTSAGRTVHELTALRIPAIIIAANDREKMHTFGIKAGMSFLGMHDKVTDARIQDELVSLIVNPSKRKKIKDSLSKYDLTQGKKEVVSRIREILSIDSRSENKTGQVL